MRAHPLSHRSAALSVLFTLFLPSCNSSFLLVALLPLSRFTRTLSSVLLFYISLLAVPPSHRFHLPCFLYSPLVFSSLVPFSLCPSSPPPPLQYPSGALVRAAYSPDRHRGQGNGGASLSSTQQWAKIPKEETTLFHPFAIRALCQSCDSVPTRMSVCVRLYVEEAAHVLPAYVSLYSRT